MKKVGDAIHEAFLKQKREEKKRKYLDVARYIYRIQTM